MESLPWIEKYRPKKLDEIVGNPYSIQQFKKISTNGNIPHMILTGPPGTGKTSCVLCLAKALLDDNFKDAYLELNASDERNIEAIRGKIKNFCKKMVFLKPGIHKIIFLDEAESLTLTSQHALRRIIENYTNTTRFIMACNSSNQIIEAIQSRCVIIRFSKIDTKDMFGRAKEICDHENIKYTDEGLNDIIIHSEGDMRRLVNDMQSIHNTIGDTITSETVMEIINKPSMVMINNIVENCFNNEFNTLEKQIEELLTNGYASIDIIKMLFIAIINKNIINDDIKLHFLKEISNTEMCLINGGDPYIQLLGLMARICLIIEKK